MGKVGDKWESRLRGRRSSLPHHTLGRLNPPSRPLPPSLPPPAGRSLACLGRSVLARPAPFPFPFRCRRRRSRASSSPSPRLSPHCGASERAIVVLAPLPPPVYLVNHYGHRKHPLLLSLSPSLSNSLSTSPPTASERAHKRTIIHSFIHSLGSGDIEVGLANRQ